MRRLRSKTTSLAIYEGMSIDSIGTSNLVLRDGDSGGKSIVRSPRDFDGEGGRRGDGNRARSNTSKCFKAAGMMKI